MGDTKDRRERRERVNVTLEPDVAAELHDWPRGTRARYLSTVLRERWMDFHSALRTLRAAGWMRAEILAACDALNGYWMLPTEDWEQQGPAVALELSDAERLHGTAARHGVGPTVWEARWTQVRQSEALTRALRHVVREFWADNPAAERAIERVDE